MLEGVLNYNFQQMHDVFVGQVHKSDLHSKVKSVKESQFSERKKNKLKRSTRGRVVILSSINDKPNLEKQKTTKARKCPMTR